MHKVKHCDHKPISARVEPPRDTVVVPPGHQPVTRLTPTAALVGVTRDKLHLSGNMKRILRKIRDKIKLKEDLPPPYQENESPGNIHREERFADVHFTENSTPYEALDLLANCHITRRTEDLSDSEVEYAEIEEMGLWHSTPLSQRHKSKISLTWVLKENLESTKHQPTHHEERIKSAVSDVDRYQRHNQKFSDKDRQRKCDRQKPRVVGRNEYYHNMKFKSACEPVNQESCSEDYSVGTEECRRKHRHRHRRKKRHRQSGRFGYDIRDLDCFLSEASIDRPGNIPVVVAYPTVLYQTHSGNQQELTLPLGTVVNAVFKNKQWLYTQTPHGEEGYVMYNACLPLGILPNRTSPQKKTPCWESSTDIYPRPCGNLTDTEKEKLRGRTRSETRNRTNTSEKRRTTKSCAEEDFDTLYLKTKSVCSDIEKTYDKVKKVQKSVKRQMLLVVNSDFEGSSYNRTLSVRQGEVVVLVQGRGESDVDADWFYVRKRDGSQGFIPAVVAGHGYI